MMHPAPRPSLRSPLCATTTRTQMGRPSEQASVSYSCCPSPPRATASLSCLIHCPIHITLAAPACSHVVSADDVEPQGHQLHASRRREDPLVALVEDDVRRLVIPFQAPLETKKRWWVSYLGCSRAGRKDGLVTHHNIASVICDDRDDAYNKCTEGQGRVMISRGQTVSISRGQHAKHQQWQQCTHGPSALPKSRTFSASSALLRQKDAISPASRGPVTTTPVTNNATTVGLDPSRLASRAHLCCVTCCTARIHQGENIDSLIHLQS